ncbi:sterol desaturase family protein [Caenimonas terrae]|uniref:Sterol desaturase family protein n=1 Tax=Caenimonas terrae TaxID=696074 RepID=A0ABW0NJH3_9BURK
MYDYLYPYFFQSFHAMYLALSVLVPLMVLEVLVPGRRLHWPTVAFNLAYAPVFIAVAAMALQPIASRLDPHLTLNLLNGRAQHWGAWQVGLLALVYLACYDFLYYWLHRAQHRFALLWRFHQFHHADVNLSASSAFRHHWLEDTFRYFSIAVPLLLLFGNIGGVIPWLALFMGGYGLFIHWNTRLGLGPLDGVFVGPRYHRIHHSLAPEHRDKNFAIFFPVIDRWFGTQVLPEPGQVPVTGVVGLQSPNHLKHLLPLPPRNAG